MDFKHKKYKGKCPSCDAIISYTEVIFSVTNDNGAMICECKNCNSQFKISVINPDDSSVDSGALKVKFLDFDSEDHERHSYSYTELYSKIQYDLDLNTKIRRYPLEFDSLYICQKCERNLEKLAFAEFQKNEDKVNRANYDAVNWILAHSRVPDYKKIIVSMPFKCECGMEANAIFYRAYTEEFGANFEDYLLGNVAGAAKLSDRVDGVMTKTSAMNLLCKLIIRWNLFSQRVLIATPFVGHQYTSDSELMEIWTSILSWLDHTKSILYTKTATANKFKAAFKEILGIDYSFLVEYELGINAFDSTVKKNDFHAKFFCGISESNSEVLSGSANLLPGTSLENISLKQYDAYFKLHSRYLKAFGLKGLDHAELPEFNEYSLMLKQKDINTYNWGEINYSQYETLR